MSQQSDPVAYWKLSAMKYPLMSKVVPQYLSVPASSVITEQVFSVAVFRLERCRLNKDVVKKLMFTKNNP